MNHLFPLSLSLHNLQLSIPPLLFLPVVISFPSTTVLTYLLKLPTSSSMVSSLISFLFPAHYTALSLFHSPLLFFKHLPLIIWSLICFVFLTSQSPALPNVLNLVLLAIPLERHNFIFYHLICSPLQLMLFNQLLLPLAAS